MSGIDPDKLRYLREKFERDVGRPDKTPYVKGAEEVRKELSGMGLDMDDDVTYELLRDGLTKQKFDDLEFLNYTHFVTHAFHGAQNLSWQKYGYIDDSSKHQAIVTLILSIDHYLPVLKSRSLPADADPYHRQVFEMLMVDHAGGKLREYCADLAVNAAVESHRNFVRSMDEIKRVNNIRLDSVLYYIKTAKDLAKEMTPERKAMFFDVTGTDQSALDEGHKSIALSYGSELLRKQPAPVPQYVSGHVSDYSYQLTLDVLAEAGVDMNDEQTYAALGTDRQAFWSNYKVQSDWLSKDKPRYQRTVYNPPSPT